MIPQNYEYISQLPINSLIINNDEQSCLPLQWFLCYRKNDSKKETILYSKYQSYHLKDLYKVVKQEYDLQINTDLILPKKQLEKVLKSCDLILKSEGK